MTDPWEHICIVCFRPASDHAGDGPEHDNAPALPLCCHGCGCGSEVRATSGEAPADDLESQGNAGWDYEKDG